MHPHRLLVLILTILAGCGSAITDPAASLCDPGRSRSVHRDALRMLMTQPGSPEPAAIDAVQGMAYRPGYDQEMRLEGLAWLARVDRDTLLTTLRRRLPRVSDHDWLRALCAFVAEHNLTELDEALVSSWGRPWSGNLPDAERPEYLALLHMHGQGAPERIVWETFLGATKASQNGLRFRCWDLLHRLGGRDRLIELVSAETEIDSDGHPLLKSLHAAAVSFGTVPWNREEVLWIHKLTEPSRADFWESAEAATAAISPERRGALEIRDLPIIAAAARHHPELLAASLGQLYTQIQRRIANQRHFREQDPGFLPGKKLDHRLSAHRDQLTWGDLLAISMALEALKVPQVRAHVFHFADRDLMDETTEYGGVIDLDEAGRFNVREFPPRVRVHDLRFEASQQMFDAGYTGLFHFHNHVQKHRNGAHAGPGAGDMAYADNTRANCLLFTFVDENTMNVDYYRHDRVLVDLGVILRPMTAQGGG
ncbi:MAG: hypothetical protein QF471_03055 [Phycisphaerales bacterium]|jgi:hypothetical protein|nr:hypothetical protein [Phycisphaerales bacterium]